MMKTPEEMASDYCDLNGYTDEGLNYLANLIRQDRLALLDEIERRMNSRPIFSEPDDSHITVAYSQIREMRDELKAGG